MKLKRSTKRVFLRSSSKSKVNGDKMKPDMGKRRTPCPIPTFMEFTKLRLRDGRSELPTKLGEQIIITGIMTIQE